MNSPGIHPKRLLWSMVALSITAPTWAHHSLAGYDMAKTMTAEVTLKEFRWVSPHSSAVFIIKGADGKSENMTVTSATPATFLKQGFKPRDFQEGDKMEITWHPSKNGHLGGALAMIKLPNGQVFKDIEFEAASRLAAEQIQSAK